MRRISAVVALTMGLGFVSEAKALTMVPKNFPADSQKQATQQQLPMTVAIYQNRIAVLATTPQTHEVKVGQTSVDATLARTLTQNAGTPVTMPNLIRALQAEIKKNPKAAVPLTLAAFSTAKNSGLNETATVSLVIAAIQSLKNDNPGYMDNIATLIGFAVAASPSDQYANVLRQLRDLVIFQSSSPNRADVAFSLDESLVKYRVVEAEYANEDYFAALASFLPDSAQGDISQDSFDLDLAFFNIENGVFSPPDGALLVAPFTGGASGTLNNPSPSNNNTSPQLNESVDPNTPVVNPTLAPTPTPTPTPAPPTPVPTPPIPVS